MLRSIGESGRFIAFVDGDVLRYISPPPGLSGEDQVIGHVEGRWQALSWLRASLKAVGFAQSTFIDPSISEGAQEPPLWVRFKGGNITFSTRITLPAGFALEPSLQGKAIRYREYAGDYNESRPGIRLSWTRNGRLELSAAYFQSTRRYAQLTQSTAGNRPLPGQLLSLHQREAEVRAATKFDALGKWTIATALGRLENRDRSRGFLDYDQDRIRVDTSYERSRWSVTFSADARRLDYLVQKVGAGLVSERPARIAEGYGLDLRIEREFSERWSAFAENRWERNRSNVVDDDGVRPFSYTTNTALVGVKRTF